MFRKPNFTTRIKARTTGRAKRAIKSSVNPFYGKKGMGYLKNPSKAYKDRWYKKTTVDSLGFMKGGSTYNDDAYYDDFHDEFPLVEYLTPEEKAERHRIKEERRKKIADTKEKINTTVTTPFKLVIKFIFKHFFIAWIIGVILMIIFRIFGV